MINSVRNTVQSILNKNNYGYLPPQDFNLFAKNAQTELFLDFIKEYNTLTNMVNARRLGEGYADRLRIVQENIEVFTRTDSLTQVADNTFAVPSLTTTGYQSLMFIKLLCYDVTSVGPPVVRTFKGEAEKVPQDRITLLANSVLTAPSSLFPAYGLQDNVITVLPDTFNQQGSVDGTYIRYPRDPKWTYETLANGSPVFDQTQPDYQDFEVGQDEEPRLVTRILQYAGLSIREADVVNYTAQKEATDNQEQ